MFNIKKGDRAPAFATIIEAPAGTPVDLSGCTVKFLMTAYGGANKINAAATVTDATGGAVSYSFDSDDTDTAGLFIAEWEVTFAGGIKRTFPENDYLYVNITSDLG